MAAKHRKSGRTAQKRKVSNKVDVTDASGASHDPSESLNAKGLATLPIEVLQMIINNIPSFPVLCTVFAHSPRDFPESMMIRKRTLHALIQTCRWLRRACLPMAWSSLDVVENLWHKHEMPDFEEKQTVEVVEQLEIVYIRN